MKNTNPPHRSYEEIDFSKPALSTKLKVNWRKLPLKKAFFIAWIISPVPFGIPAATYFLGRETIDSLKIIFNRFKRQPASSLQTLPECCDVSHHKASRKIEQSKLG